jgi:hypothetical protein
VSRSLDCSSRWYACGLGDGDSGPVWQFSVKEEFDRHLEGCYEDDKLSTFEALLALAESVRKKISADDLRHERAFWKDVDDEQNNVIGEDAS